MSSAKKWGKRCTLLKNTMFCVCLERLEKEGGEGNREWNERVQSSGGCDVRFPPPFTSHQSASHYKNTTQRAKAEREAQLQEGCMSEQRDDGWEKKKEAMKDNLQCTKGSNMNLLIRYSEMQL